MLKFSAVRAISRSNDRAPRSYTRLIHAVSKPHFALMMAALPNFLFCILHELFSSSSTTDGRVALRGTKCTRLRRHFLMWRPYGAADLILRQRPLLFRLLHSLSRRTRPRRLPHFVSFTATSNSLLTFRTMSSKTIAVCNDSDLKDGEMYVV